MNSPARSRQMLFRSPELPPRYALFDIHVHLGSSDTGEIYYPHLTGDEYLAHMRASNIAAACAFAPFRANGYRLANRDLLDWSKTTDGRIYPFARLGGQERPVTVAESWMVRRKISGWLRRRPADLGSWDELSEFSGIKLLPQLDGLPDDEAFDRIAELRLPVLVHGGTHCPPKFIERRILPRLRGPLIIAHCGCFPCDERSFFDAIAIAQKHDQVYLDTSGVAVSEFLRYAAERIPEQLVFGSDSPLSHPLVAWHHLASTLHDDQLLERIGRITSRTLFSP